MRILTFLAVLAGVLGPLATSAIAADLDDYGPPPRPYYEPRPVPPAFVPDRVPPVLVRPVVYPRVVRPYGFYGPRPVVRVYGEPRVYGEGYGRAYREPGYERERTVVRREREEFGREGYGREGYGYGRNEGRGYERERDAYHHERERSGYGRYLNRDELEHRAEREHGGGYDRERFAGRETGYGRDERFADRGLGRDFDR